MLSAFFSGTESAFTALSPAQIEKIRRKQRSATKLVYTLCQDIPTVLYTVLIGNNLMNITLTVLASNLTIRIFGNEFLGYTTAILTFIVLTFGEVYPKQFAINHSERWSRITVYPLYVFRILFYPVIELVRLLTAIFGASKKRYTQFTRDNVLHQIHAAAGIGVLKQRTSQLLINTLAFERETAQIIMTHRTNIFSIAVTTPFSTALQQISSSGYSRVPVYERHPENIIGIALLKDLIRASLQPKPDTLAQMIHKPHIISQSMHLDQVFLQMRRVKSNMIIVIDEYGELAGLLTIEDLFEKIFGQLYDEHETVERDITPYGKHSYMIRAAAPIAQINQQLSINIPLNRGMTTLGGYLTNLYGNVPPAYEIIFSPFGSFEIVSASNKRIISVIFRKKKRDASRSLK